MSSVKKLSQDIKTETIITSVFVAFELLFKHNKIIEIIRRTELAEKKIRMSLS